MSPQKVAGCAAAVATGHRASPALACSDVSMAYVAGIWAIRGIDLRLEPGTVTAVAGENGAGKSTLYRILAGIQAPTRGTVSVCGSPLKLGQARSQGVAYVPQELASCRDLRVYENLFLGSEVTGHGGVLRKKRMIAAAAAATRRFDVELDPRARARTLSTAALQVLEILKSVRTTPAVWILDEPTSSLSDAQAQRLFEEVDRLKRDGAAVLYTTHRMDEIQRIADRVIVLRDGGLVMDEPSRNVRQSDIVGAMLGRQASDLYPAIPPVPEDRPVALEVCELRVAGLEGEFNLTVRAGEIVGLAGLVGAGRSELLEAIFGMRPAQGRIRVAGKQVRLGDSAAAIRAGLAYVPEDRKEAGLVGELSICDNITLPWLRTFGTVLSHGAKRRATADRVAADTGLRYRSIQQRVSRLSGGNQQKVLVGRNLVGSVAVLLLDEPTRGVDVGARAEIYEILIRLADQGLAILMVSSDRDEVVNLSHRIAVMRQRRIVGFVDRANGDPRDDVLRLSLGYDSEPQVNDVSPDAADRT